MESTFGKFSRADSSGIYAIGSDGEERLVGHWQRPRCSPLGEIESLKKKGDKYEMKMRGVNCKLYMLA